MWGITLSWWEFVIRAVVVYFFLLIGLRLSGKRQISQMAPFDLVLLLILSNAVQNSMNGGDNSITAGLILATTLITVNSILGWITYRCPHLETVIEGKPMILIHDGKIDRSSMRDANMTTHELETALRAAGCSSPSEVRFAVLENNGKVSIIPKPKEAESKDKPTTQPDSGGNS
jgi:uncharacterized membrane protein YcaP (DUF421 family)